jgi:arylsulfatase A-like enzyme
MTDEHNFRTLGAYRKQLSKEQALMWGSEVVETPNIDWLADNGAIATSFYASSPVCTPSRGAFVTGMYPQNNHSVQNNIPLRDDEITFAKVLKDNGYATGYIGKWHLDGKGKPQWAPKRKFGFDDNRFMYNRGHYKQFKDTSEGPRVAALDKKGKPSYDVDGADEKSFSTDYQMNKLIDYIDANKKHPFAMMLSLSDPHGPDSVRSPYDTMYNHIKFEMPRTSSVKAKDTPNWGAPRPQPKIQRMSQYYGMIKLIDDNIGRLLTHLKKADILDNTIIVFTSDHGDLKSEHNRQNKGVPFEGSAKVPFIVYYPDKIKPVVINEAMTSVDFQPTLMGLLGIKGSGNEDGRDASKLLIKGQVKNWKDVAFFRQSSSKGKGWLTVVSDRYKLVYNTWGEPWLFDLEKDPDELVNFYNNPQYIEVIRDMAMSLQKYAADYNDPYYDNSHIKTGVEKAIQEI